MDKTTQDMFERVGTWLWLHGCENAIDQWSKDCGVCRSCKAREGFKEIKKKYKKLEDAIISKALKEK